MSSSQNIEKQTLCCQRAECFFILTKIDNSRCTFLLSRVEADEIKKQSECNDYDEGSECNDRL